jgi:anti-sigma factor RsiW
MTGEAMTGCSEWLELLSARLDDALPEEDQERTEGHLAGCRECRQRLASLRALKHAVARLPGREAPTGALRAHVESLALRGRRPPRLGVALPVALALTLAVGSWGLVSLRRLRNPPSPQLADELAADHLHSVPEAMPAEVVTEDGEAAVRFFTGRLPFTPVAPRLEGARLIGGRLCRVRGRRVQLLFYRAEPTGTLSLFVSDQDLGAEGCREARGLQVCSRRTGGLTLLVVGGGPPDDLRRLIDSAAF